MRVVRTTVVVTAIILALVGAVVVISYGYHRMTNPSFSPGKHPTTTRTTAMAAMPPAFRMIDSSAR
jgi:hypothetical protein